MASTQPKQPATDSKPPRPPAFLNQVMAGLLRSPLHGLMSANLMLLTFTGRKSGKQFTTPVTYSYLSPDRLLVFTSSSWWKNLRGGAPVSLRIKGKLVQGTAEPTDDRQTIIAETRAYLAKKGVRNARMIGLQIDPKRELSQEYLDEVTRGRAVIYIQIVPTV